MNAKAAKGWETMQEGDGLRTERLAVPGGHLYRVAALDWWDRECGFSVAFAPAKAAAVKAKKAPPRQRRFKPV